MSVNIFFPLHMFFFPGCLWMEWFIFTLENYTPRAKKTPKQNRKNSTLGVLFTPTCLFSLSIFRDCFTVCRLVVRSINLLNFSQLGWLQLFLRNTVCCHCYLYFYSFNILLKNSLRIFFFFKLVNKGPMIHMTHTIITFDILLHYFKFYFNKNLAFLIQ